MAKAQPIRVGIVGLGRAGRGMHCKELADREKTYQVTAVCDTIKARRDDVAAELGCAAYARIEKLIADPNVDLVDIATRSTEHVPHALLALKANKDVFLEKPISVSYAEAKKLVPAVKKSRGRLFIRQQRRFETAFLHIREIIASGVLGDVRHVKLCRGGYSRRDDWQTLKRCGGGQLLNWGPHVVDQALQYLGAPVESMFSDLQRMAAVGDAEDQVKIVLRGTNGRVVDLEICGGAAIKPPECMVWGTKGSLQASSSEITLRYLDPRKKLSRRRAKSGTPEKGFGSPDDLKWVEKTLKAKPKKSYDIWEEMYNSIRKGTTFPITLDEILEVMKVISAAKKGTAFA